MVGFMGIPSIGPPAYGREGICTPLAMVDHAAPNFGRLCNVSRHAPRVRSRDLTCYLGVNSSGKGAMGPRPEPRQGNRLGEAVATSTATTLRDSSTAKKAKTFPRQTASPVDQYARRGLSHYRLDCRANLPKNDHDHNS